MMDKGEGTGNVVGFGILLIVVVLFLMLLLAKWAPEPEERPSVCANGFCWFIEVRDTAEERGLGLMNRENLPQNEAMLFVFEREDIYSFWMKNTLIPLDMVWLDSSGAIVYVQENAVPCRQDPCMSYTPDSVAKYVVEFNAGTAKRYGFREGDRVDLVNLELAK